MIRLVLALIAVSLLSGCLGTSVINAGDGGGGGGAGGAANDAGPMGCMPCATGSDCDSAAACTQYSGDSFCAKNCLVGAECAPSDECALATDFTGNQVRVCLPRTGSCVPDAGCGTCPMGSTCDLSVGICEATPDAGPAPMDAGTCGTQVPPATASCCHACVPGAAGCQANGCFGGWWCDQANPSSCGCRAPPTTCNPTSIDGGPKDGGTPDAGSPDAGKFDAGSFDAGPVQDGGLIGPNGGTVDRLFFAVVGDTRPPSPFNPVANYPTAVITKIYADIAVMNPRPQFVIGTGDYQFSNPLSNDAALQLTLYGNAKGQYPGTVFAAMGNHECTSPTASNCVGTFARKNYDAFMAALVTPLGKTLPYYSIPVQTSAGLTRFIFAACNAWDATQKSWLQSELAAPATFRVIVRHESLTATGPCSSEMNPMIAAAGYNLLLVGHTHLFSHTGKELIVGMGGAPITGSTPFGYITVEQLAVGGWKIIQYDSTTSLPVSTFVVP